MITRIKFDLPLDDVPKGDKGKTRQEGTATVAFLEKAEMMADASHLRVAADQPDQSKSN